MFGINYVCFGKKTYLSYQLIAKNNSINLFCNNFCIFLKRIFKQLILSPNNLFEIKCCLRIRMNLAME